MDVELLLSALGWCSLINISLLLFASLMLIIGKRFSLGLHGAMFDLDEGRLNQAYFQFLANYKLLILVFNVTPYFALQLANVN